MNRCHRARGRRRRQLHIYYAENATTRPAMRRRRRQRTIQHTENTNLRPEARRGGTLRAIAGDWFTNYATRRS